MYLEYSFHPNEIKESEKSINYSSPFTNKSEWSSTNQLSSRQFYKQFPLHEKLIYIFRCRDRYAFNQARELMKWNS